MAKLCSSYNKVLIIFACLASNSMCDSAASEDITNFIETFMEPPITIVIGNSTDVTPILKVSYPRVLVNIYRKNPKMARQKNSNIIIVDDLDELETAIRTLSTIKIWHSRFKHLIIFLKPVTENMVRQSFRLMFRWRMVNVVVHHKNDAFYTWYPYSEQSRCGTVVNLVRVKDENPFSSKIPKVLHGCGINVTWPKLDIFMWDPFNETYPGAMFMFFNTIAKKMNITVNYLRNNTNFLQR